MILVSYAIRFVVVILKFCEALQPDIGPGPLTASVVSVHNYTSNN